MPKACKQLLACLLAVAMVISYGGVAAFGENMAAVEPVSQEQDVTPGADENPSPDAEEDAPSDAEEGAEPVEEASPVEEAPDLEETTEDNSEVPVSEDMPVSQEVGELSSAEELNAKEVARTEFKGTLKVGGVEVPCTYTLITGVEGGDYVELGNGVSAAIDPATSGDVELTDTVGFEGTQYPLKVISTGAFSNCQKITSTGLATNTSVQEIQHAFCNCDSLTSTGMETNSTVTTLGDYAFHGCDNIVYAAIGAGVTSMAAMSFSISNSIVEMCFYGNTVPSTPLNISSQGQGSFKAYYLSSNANFASVAPEKISPTCTEVIALSSLTVVNGVCNNEPETYWAKLAGSASEGLWAEGEVASISATIPSSAKFDKWTVEPTSTKIADANATETTITMDKVDVIATAEVVETPVEKGHRVIYKISGTIPAGYTVPVDSARYMSGAVVALKSAPEQSAYVGYDFTGWTLAGTEAGRATMADADIVVEGVWTKASSAATTSVENVEKKKVSLQSAQVTPDGTGTTQKKLSAASSYPHVVLSADGKGLVDTGDVPLKMLIAALVAFTAACAIIPAALRPRRREKHNR